MGLEKRTASLDLSKYKPGLVYDAEAVSLLGKYTDELSAHRGKRQWMETLGNYFLLERDRDYELFVDSSLSDKSFVVCCEFNSACGRYAFWRLINQQAPEAEQQLGCTITRSVSRSAKRSLPNVDTRKEAWLFGSIDDQVNENEETRHLIARLLKLFQS